MSNISVRSFSSGELAPALHARTDLAKYESGLRICRNMIVMRQGGATKRPGTEFVCEVADSTQKVREIPFVFNVSDTLVLVFGDFTLRFIQNGGVVEDPMDPGEAYEIATPYAVADLPALQYVQSGDVVTIVHPSYRPYELTRTTNTSWNLNAIVFGPTLGAPTISSVTLGDAATTLDASYILTRVGTNGEESLGSAPVTVAHPPTATSPTFIEAVASGADTFNLYRQDGGAGVYGFIGAGIGPVIEWHDYGTIPDNTLQPPVDPALFQSADNYPSVVAYYQQRLLFANSNTHPDTVWASRTGYYHNFTTSVIVQDDDAITFRLVSKHVDAIRHIINLGRLVIMTEGAEWLIEGDGNGVLTPVSVNARIGSANGVAAIQPIEADSRLLYVQALGSAIRDLQSDVQFGFYSLVGRDITIYASHLVDGFSITDWAWQQVPMHLIWAVRSDGVLLSLTYIPEQELLAWHRHDTLGFVENVCVVPEGRSHWLYVVVKRLINGSYRRYVERMTTSNVLPVFATPEDAAAAPGGIVTPPPPPPPPPPSTTPIPPPTSASTTDITSTSATFNWIPGSELAPTEITYGVNTSAVVVVTVVAGGTRSLHVTGLSVQTNYTWLARHLIGTEYSTILGPNNFRTADATLTLDAPPSAPVLVSQTHNSGSTDLLITWTAPTTTFRVSRLQIAGPTDLTPTDGEFSDIGVFGTGLGSATSRVLHAGRYWLRVRYEQQDFTNSAYAGPSDWLITVTDEV